MEEEEKVVLDYCVKDIEYRIKSRESSYEKGENNFDKIFLYNENYYEPKIIKSD